MRLWPRAFSDASDTCKPSPVGGVHAVMALVTAKRMIRTDFRNPGSTSVHHDTNGARPFLFSMLGGKACGAR